ncbi:uncharacterized protein TNCV_661401 [Trichonephila clavipes]|nr:uncharacterized protein TNCV_661401 [Trichonephila clavipes]
MFAFSLLLKSPIRSEISRANVYFGDAADHWQTALLPSTIANIISQSYHKGAHPVEWLVTLTAVPLGLGLNLGEDMDVCKCFVPSWHGGTLNSRRTTSHLVRLVEGEEKWEAPDNPQGVLPQNWVKPS